MIRTPIGFSFYPATGKVVVFIDGEPIQQCPDCASFTHWLFGYAGLGQVPVIYLGENFTSTKETV